MNVYQVNTLPPRVISPPASSSADVMPHSQLPFVAAFPTCSRRHLCPIFSECVERARSCCVCGCRPGFGVTVTAGLSVGGGGGGGATGWRCRWPVRGRAMMDWRRHQSWRRRRYTGLTHLSHCGTLGPAGGTRVSSCRVCCGAGYDSHIWSVLTGITWVIPAQIDWRVE